MPERRGTGNAGGSPIDGKNAAATMKRDRVAAGPRGEVVAGGQGGLVLLSTVSWFKVD
ncbi:MAG: hypothetical protein KatS3mg110_3180 [Pirellulaceae bacterium]|nr:MAG: hypothetical protein KatS3mg110_3180 [Pirellulaceae bacterium]